MFNNARQLRILTILVSLGLLVGCGVESSHSDDRNVEETRALTTISCQEQGETQQQKDAWCGDGQNGLGICQTGGGCACSTMWCLDRDTGQCVTPKVWAGNDIGFACPSPTGAAAVLADLLEGSWSQQSDYAIPPDTSLLRVTTTAGVTTGSYSYVYYGYEYRGTLEDFEMRDDVDPEPGYTAVLQATWREESDYGVSYEGLVRWQIAPDGQSMDGTWGYDQDYDAANSFWNLTRIVACTDESGTAELTLSTSDDSNPDCLDWDGGVLINAADGAVLYDNDFFGDEDGDDCATTSQTVSASGSYVTLTFALVEDDIGFELSDSCGTVVAACDHLTQDCGTVGEPVELIVPLSLAGTGCQAAGDRDAWCGAGQHGLGFCQQDGSCTCSDMWCLDAVTGKCTTPKQWGGNEVGYTCDAVVPPADPLAAVVCQEAGSTQQLKDAWCGAGQNGLGQCLSDNSCACSAMWCVDCDGRCTSPREWAGNDTGYVCPVLTCSP